MSEMTLGQSAYEARIAARRTRLLCAGESAQPEPPAWAHLSAGERADEEAGAQRAIAAYFASLGTVAAEQVLAAIRESLKSAPAREMAWLRELYAAAVDFADIWAELLVSMPDDYGCEMNCAEAEAVAGLYRVLGNDNTARAVIAAHAAHDDEEERAAHDEDDGSGPSSQLHEGDWDDAVSEATS